MFFHVRRALETAGTLELFLMRTKHIIAVIHRRNLALKSRELTAEQGLLSLRAQKAEAATKEGAGAARDEEARVLKEHQVHSYNCLFSFKSTSSERSRSTYVKSWSSSPELVFREHNVWSTDTIPSESGNGEQLIFGGF